MEIEEGRPAALHLSSGCYGPDHADRPSMVSTSMKFWASVGFVILALAIYSLGKLGVIKL